MGALYLFFLIAVPSAFAALLWDHKKRQPLDLDKSDRRFAARHRCL